MKRTYIVMVEEVENANAKSTKENFCENDKIFNLLKLLVIVYNALMFFGIITVNPYLIILGSSYNFSYSFLTSSFVSERKRITSAYEQITYNSIKNKKLILGISLLFGVAFCVLCYHMEDCITAPFEFLKISNLGNLFMGGSFVLMLLDSDFFKFNKS